MLVRSCARRHYGALKKMQAEDYFDHMSEELHDKLKFSRVNEKIGLNEEN